MSKFVYATNAAEFRESLPEIGRGGVVGSVWKIRSESEAREDAENIRKGIYIVDEANKSKRVRADSLHPDIVAAGYDVAIFSNDLSLLPIDLHPKKKITVPPIVFGHNTKKDNGVEVTGLHVDVHGPAISFLHVGVGAMRGYFRQEPIEAAKKAGVAQDTIEDVSIDVLHTSNKNAIKDGSKHLFADIELAQGTCLAFAAAGAFYSGIAPTSHQVESLTDERYSLPILEENYAVKFILRS